MWKSGKCLTFTEVTTKQVLKGGGKKKTDATRVVRFVKQQKRVESFFHFFKAPKTTGATTHGELLAYERRDVAKDFRIAQAFRIGLR